MNESLSASRKPLSIRTFLPRVLNLLLWLVFCLLCATGSVLAFRLPPGSRGGRGLELLGLGRHEWGDLHGYVSWAFVALIVVHLALHWRWLWQVASRKRSWPILAGILAGMLVIAAAFAIPVSKGHGRESEKHHR